MTGYLSTEKIQKQALLSNFTPSIMAPQVLEDILVQRHELVADLVDRITISITTDNKHFPLLIGARGMGKTHLVSIVYNRIQQRADLQDLVIIAWLREEEWGISSWLDLVVRIFRSIGEEYPDTEVSSIAINNITTLQSHSPTEAEVLAESLLAELVGKKTLFLIIENLDDVFDGLGTNGQQRLRSFLQEHPCCTILATTPVLFNGITKRDEAFYGWFTPFHLEPLTHENAIELLTNIAAQSGDKELASFLHTPAGSARVRAVHRLAGGNPRVYTLFAQLITKQDLDSLVGAFMKMLDDLMPYYQSRMAMLSPQQRKIVAYLVDNTEAVIVKDIATWCFATPQTISSQLKDLKGKGYVKSESHGKESYYELNEVLMRLCLEVKKYRGKEVESLVEMIRIWYRPEEIKAQFDRLSSLGNSAHARYYQLALEDSRPHPMLLACDRDLQKYLEIGDAKLVLQVWQELAHVQNTNNELFQTLHDLIIAEKFDEFWYFIGILLWRRDRLENAIISFDRAIGIKPDFYEAWSDRGNALIDSDRYEEAIDSFDRVIEINSDHYESWFSRGVGLNKLGKYQEAINSYDRVIKIKPDDNDAWNNRGIALAELGKYEEAIANYNRAVEISSDDNDAWHNQGFTFYRWGKYQDALDAYQQAINIKPDAYNSWHDRGLVFFQLGNYAEAIDAWRSAFKIIRDLQPSDTSNLIQELLDDQLLAKFQQPAVRDLMSQLLEIYADAEVLPELGVALTRNLKAVMSPIISDYTANEWLKMWQELGKPHPELGLALKMVAAGVKYKQNPQDKRIFMALPQELRPLVREALGLDGDMSKATN
jgi:tetratricopeptide (TPR) repeat protein